MAPPIVRLRPFSPGDAIVSLILARPLTDAESGALRSALDGWAAKVAHTPLDGGWVHMVSELVEVDDEGPRAEMWFDPGSAGEAAVEDALAAIVAACDAARLPVERIEVE